MEYNPFSQALQEDPYPTYRWLREEAPLYRSEEFGFVAVSRYEDVKAVIRDGARLSNREGVDIDNTEALLAPGGIDEMDDPDHSTIRKLMQSWFSPKSIRTRLEEPIRDEVRELVEELRERDEIDATSELAWQLPTLVVARMFDLPDSERPELLSFMRPVFNRVPDDPNPPGTAIEAGRRIGEYMLAKIRERRGERLEDREDLISVLLKAEPEGRKLDDQQVLAHIAFLVVASSGTTQDSMSNTLFLLANHPDERRKLIDDPGLIGGAVEEALRCESPIQVVYRLALEDLTLRDETVAAGTRVLAVLAAANRDDRYWEDAETFDVTREPRRHMTFADGVHHCLGAPIGRFETRIVVEEVLRTMPDFELGAPPVRTVQHVGRGFEKLFIVPNVSVAA